MHLECLLLCAWALQLLFCTASTPPLPRRPPPTSKQTSARARRRVQRLKRIRLGEVPALESTTRRSSRAPLRPSWTRGRIWPSSRTCGRAWRRCGLRFGRGGPFPLLLPYTLFFSLVFSHPFPLSFHSFRSFSPVFTHTHTSPFLPFPPFRRTRNSGTCFLPHCCVGSGNLVCPA